MKNSDNSERALAYKTARVLSNDELTKIGGGAATGTTVYTTKQTADNYGNWDAGADVQWD